MSEETIVLFKEGIDGQEAEYVEIIEDSDERLVVKATFGMVDEVVEALTFGIETDDLGLQALVVEVPDAPVEGIGTAEGHVVSHLEITE